MKRLIRPDPFGRTTKLGTSLLDSLGTVQHSCAWFEANVCMLLLCHITLSFVGVAVSGGPDRCVALRSCTCAWRVRVQTLLGIMLFV